MGLLPVRDVGTRAHGTRHGPPDHPSTPGWPGGPSPFPGRRHLLPKPRI
ncbi:hypothetical protein SFR_2966 [Streptomyces sp. FR-008]|nr:hypothetical protein SFR_2966 [Streptomyces sp. FR-008]